MATMFLVVATGSFVLSRTVLAEDSKPPAIDPVFDCYAANSAWGLVYSGKVIDRNGRTWSYSQRGKALAPASGPGEPKSYDGAALRAKFAGAEAGAQVDAATLADKIALIDKAAGGRITATDTGVRDAGMSSCHAYVRDAAGSGYSDVELGSDGGVADRRIDNSAPEAKALLDWLHSLGVAR